MSPGGTLHAMILSPEAAGTISLVLVRPVPVGAPVGPGQPGFMQISPASALDIVRSLIRSRRALVESGTAATCALYSSTHIAICALK